VFYCCTFVIFFFSSRRRHTRCYRDWSSDVCSSDLGDAGAAELRPAEAAVPASATALVVVIHHALADERGIDAGADGGNHAARLEIGRASCRERGEGDVRRTMLDKQVSQETDTGTST